MQEVLKTKVPFPVDIASSVSTLVDKMWEKVKEHDAILSTAVVSSKGDASQIKENLCKHTLQMLAQMMMMMMIITFVEIS